MHHPGGKVSTPPAAAVTADDRHAGLVDLTRESLLISLGTAERLMTTTLRTLDRLRAELADCELQGPAGDDADSDLRAAAHHIRGAGRTVRAAIPSSTPGSAERVVMAELIKAAEAALPFVGWEGHYPDLVDALRIAITRAADIAGADPGVPR